jgi:hypothetical protein
MLQNWKSLETKLALAINTPHGERVMSGSDEIETVPTTGDARRSARLHPVNIIAIIVVAIVIVFCAAHYINQARTQSAAVSDAIDSVGKLYAATQVGTNYTTYTTLLIDAQAAVNRAQQIVPKSEVAANLKEIVSEYYNAASVWNEQISEPHTYFPDRQLLTKYNILSPSLMDEYDKYTSEFVEVMKANPSDGTEVLRKIRTFITDHQLDPDSIMQKIWSDAGTKYKRVSKSR